MPACARGPVEEGGDAIVSVRREECYGMPMTSPVSSVGSSVSTLASALKGYETQVSTTAANIANVDSTGYKALRADAISMAPGMRVAVQPTGQEVDTTTQLVNLTTASEAYQAAASAMGSVSRTEKRSLDLIG